MGKTEREDAKMTTFDLLKTGKQSIDHLIAEHLEQAKSYARLSLLDSYVGERTYYNYVMFELSKEHRSRREVYETAIEHTRQHLSKKGAKE